MDSGGLSWTAAEQTQPVVDHYKKKALVHRVDGLGTREDVTTRLRKALTE